MLMPGILGRIVGFGLQLQNVAIPEKCRGVQHPPQGCLRLGGCLSRCGGVNTPPRGGVKISLFRSDLSHRQLYKVGALDGKFLWPLSMCKSVNIKEATMG